MDKSLILNKLKEYKKFKTEVEFANFLDTTPQNLRNWHTRNTYDVNLLINLFPFVNADWLKTGKGDMLKTDTPDTELTKKENYTLVPLYNFDAVGGVWSTNDVMDSPIYIDRHIPFVDAHKGDICIPVTGKSMMPVYPPGSIVLIREVEQWREYFGYGNVFILILNDGRRIIKEVQKSEEDAKNNVLCVSYNIEHHPEELPKSMIDKVFKVIRVLTNEGF